MKPKAISNKPKAWQLLVVKPPLPLTGLPWRNRQVGPGLLQCGWLARRRTSDTGGQSGIPSHFSIERRLEPRDHHSGLPGLQGYRRRALSIGSGDSGSYSSRSLMDSPSHYRRRRRIRRSHLSCSCPEFLECELMLNPRNQGSVSSSLRDPGLAAE